MAVVLATLGPGHLLWDVGLFFSKLAVVTFGGAYAVLAYMAQEAVQTHGWLAPGEMLEVVAAKAANAMWALRRELLELKGMAFTEQYDVMEKGVAQARREYSALDARLQEGLAEIEQEVLDTIRALETQLGVGSGLGGAEGGAEGAAEGS